MARIITKTAQGPMEIKPQKNAIHICMCGLSQNQPYCDGSHLKIIGEVEGKLYKYDEKGNREEINKK